VKPYKEKQKNIETTNTKFFRCTEGKTKMDINGNQTSKKIRVQNLLVQLAEKLLQWSSHANKCTEEGHCTPIFTSLQDESLKSSRIRG
jgi:hypothetical protein